MDNPFIGLDAGTRDLLKELLGELISEIGLQVILILSKTDDIPDFITHVIPVEDMVCGDKMPLSDYKGVSVPGHVLSEEKQKQILNLPYKDNQYYAENVVKLNKVSIKYGKRTILKDLDWTVKCGQKWALSGENGAGKSTLLSLVCADNPQSYACDITLFDRKRGSGESIWEIKKHIGYVSPEMHRAYLKNLPAIDIVASGLHDSIGLYKKTKDEDRNTCLFWMDIFGVSGLAERSFLQLSSGEQRMVLLARAFVKDPELLILDDFSMGLDPGYRRLFVEYLREYASAENKTVFLTSHIIQDMELLIDDCMIMDYGRLLLHKPVKEIMHHFKRYRFTRPGDTFKLDADEDFWHPSALSDKWEVYSFLPKAEVEQRLKAMGVTEITEEKLSLEDAFIGLTGKY